MNEIDEIFKGHLLYLELIQDTIARLSYTPSDIFKVNDERLAILQNYSNQIKFIIKRYAHPSIVLYTHDIIDIVAKMVGIHVNDDLIDFQVKNLGVWLINSEMQTAFIEKYPEYYCSFKRNKVLLPELETKYSHIPSTLDLNLL